MSILDGLDSLRVDLMNLHIPDDIAGTNNDRLYRANAVGRDNGLIEAGIYVRETLRSDKTKRAIAADLCEHEGVGKACIDCTYKAESVQELLAGGDQ